MGNLLNTIGSSVGAVGNITVILGIIVYMFAVVGMQLFKKYYIAENFPSGKVPRWNFNDFGHSFMMIFRILCGKWIEPLWNTMLVTSPLAICFILPAFVIGNFVILNLFLALLLNSFSSGGDDAENDDEEEKKETDEEKKETKTKKRRLDISRLLGRKKNALSGSRSKVGPDEEAEDSEDEANVRVASPIDDVSKKEAARTLSKSSKGCEQDNGYEMNRLPNRQTQQENTNGLKHNFGKSIWPHSKPNGLLIDKARRERGLCNSSLAKCLEVFQFQASCIFFCFFFFHHHHHNHDHHRHHYQYFYKQFL